MNGLWSQGGLMYAPPFADATARWGRLTAPICFALRHPQGNLVVGFSRW